MPRKGEKLSQEQIDKMREGRMLKKKVDDENKPKFDAADKRRIALAYINSLDLNDKVNKNIKLNYNDLLKPRKIRYSLGKERKILLTKKNEAEEKTKKITSKAIRDQIEGLNDKLKNDAAMFTIKLKEYKKLHNIKGKLKPFTTKQYHALIKKNIKKNISVKPNFEELFP